MTTPELQLSKAPSGLLQAGERIGEAYLIDRQIGVGGMGVVFRAVDERAGTAVAVKWVMAGDAHARSRERLVREWHLARQVRHPNVVEILDAGQERGASYLVMELLEGESLDAWIRCGPLDVQITIRLMMPILRGVAAAHAAGIVHRDLKPQNVVLCRAEHGVRPTIIDFGISRAAAAGVYGDRKLTQHGFMVGTPLYMAPEQLIGVGEAETASDIYALGVILFEMLSGVPPYEAGANDSSLITEKLDRSAARLGDFVRGVDPRLEAVVAKALERSPTKRFATIEEFGRALEPFTRARFADSGPVYRGEWPGEGRSSSLRTRPRRRAGKNRPPRWFVWAVVAGLSLAVGLAGLVVWTLSGDDSLHATELEPVGDVAAPPGGAGSTAAGPSPEVPVSEPLAAREVGGLESTARDAVTASASDDDPDPAPAPLGMSEAPESLDSATSARQGVTRHPANPRRRVRRRSRSRPRRVRPRGRSGRLSVDDF